MESVLLDRSSGSGSLEFPRSVAMGGGFRPEAARGTYSYFPAACEQYWNPVPAHAHALPYARLPPLYSMHSLPLLPSNQPPLLPLPPKYATFPYPPPPPQRAGRAAATAAVPAAAAPAASRQGDRRRRRPSRPPPTTESATAQKKKPLERATPLPPATVVAEALDDLEQEVARSFVQDLLHALAPPPSSLPLPRFSLVTKASPPAVAPPPAPSCNAEAAAAGRRVLRM